jgi:hypothetical protein
MEPAVEKRFRRIEAIQRETAEINRRAELRMDRVELRMDVFDKKLEATREQAKAVVRAHLLARIASNRNDASKL